MSKPTTAEMGDTNLMTHLKQWSKRKDLPAGAGYTYVRAYKRIKELEAQLDKLKTKRNAEAKRYIARIKKAEAVIDILTAQNENMELEAENKALRVYAVHSDGCHSWRGCDCTCGLKQALESES